MGVGLDFSRKQNYTESYYAANGSIPAWAVGMSMFATIISSVTFLAYPGAAYSGNWILLVQGLMVPIVLLGMIWFIVPLFRRVIRLSTYEYFERRFGPFARFYSSVAFVLEHFSKMGTILYLMGIAMTAFTGIDITYIIIIIGMVIILYLSWRYGGNHLDGRGTGVPADSGRCAHLWHAVLADRRWRIQPYSGWPREYNKIDCRSL